MTPPSKDWLADIVRRHRVRVNGGEWPDLGTAWGHHVVHSGPQRHSTGGLPHFQVAGWGRGASLLLAKSKTKWPLTVSNLLQSTWPWELLFTSNACFYLYFCRASLSICGKNIFVWFATGIPGGLTPTTTKYWSFYVFYVNELWCFSLRLTFSIVQHEAQCTLWKIKKSHQLLALCLCISLSIIY